MRKNSPGLAFELLDGLWKVEGGLRDLLDPPGRGEVVLDVPGRHPGRGLDHPRVEALHLSPVQVVVGHQREHLDPGPAAPVQVPLVRVPPELLDGDEHLDVVAAQQVVDPPRHGKLEAAEAGHHQVDHEAGERGWQQLAEDSEVIVAGPTLINTIHISSRWSSLPTCQSQPLKLDRVHLVLTLPLHDLEPGDLVPDVTQDVRDVLALTRGPLERARSPHAPEEL